MILLDAFVVLLKEPWADLLSRLPHTDGNFDDEYFKGTEESNQFRREYEMRKMKQVIY